ncbi:MAG: menaquinol oxidoreductase [Geobacteraceae bacterium GWC2_55_20]|nr:MAG: menaquinol oxidoreductase [Geobacteraceae bacterium GWC2_55_20]HCE68019.1 menaquinol oxidoreductase [Geobacter sp.]
MKRSWLIGGLVCLLSAGFLTLLLMYSLPLDFIERSPVQPFFFSHKQHAGANGIPCLYCHRYADKSSLAGIPALSDCRSCHLYISPESPRIKILHEHWNRQEPIAWIRVNSLPDHVYFPHMMHIRAGIDCSACHGDVATMERISRTVSLKMGWCLGCHRQHQASIDCWTCHI